MLKLQWQCMKNVQQLELSWIEIHFICYTINQYNTRKIIISNNSNNNSIFISNLVDILLILLLFGLTHFLSIVYKISMEFIGRQA